MCAWERERRRERYCAGRVCQFWPCHAIPGNPCAAHAGNEKALVSAEVLDTHLDIAGSLAFLLWRSVYITKQASPRRGRFGSGFLGLGVSIHINKQAGARVEVGSWII